MENEAEEALDFECRTSRWEPNRLEMLHVPQGQDANYIAPKKWWSTTTSTTAPQVEWLTLWEDQLEALSGTEYTSAYCQ